MAPGDKRPSLDDVAVNASAALDDAVIEHANAVVRVTSEKSERGMPCGACGSLADSASASG